MKKIVSAIIVCFVFAISMNFTLLTSYAEAESSENECFGSFVVQENAYLSSYSNVYSVRSSLDTDGLISYMEDAFKHFQTEIDISSYNILTSEIQDVLSFVLSELVECFHVENLFGYSYNEATSVCLTLSVSYTYTQDVYDQYMLEIEETAEKLLDGIEDNTALTDIQKALLIHDRIALHCEYDEERLENGTMPKESYTIYGVLANGIAVCQGYAETYKYLLEEVGIESQLCSSEALNHAWNIVYINDVPYHVDVTWDDPVWDISGRVNHDNFLVSSNEIYETGHDADDYDTTPCDTTYDDYFWEDSNSAFQLFNGQIYYIDNVDKELKLYDGTTLCSVDDKWYVGEDSYYSGNFSRLATDGEELYYSLSDGIYRYNLNTGESEKVFVPTHNFGDYFFIYGFAYKSSGFICELHDSPNFDDYTKSVYTMSVTISDDLTSSDVFTYTVNDDCQTVTITGFTGEAEGDLVIPSEIDGYTVTKIGDEAFLKCTGFTGSLTIPESIETIGDWAFGNCSGFSGDLIIPDGVTSIGKQAFRDCTGLNGKLEIPDSVTSIGTSAFYGCSGIESVYFYGDVPTEWGSEVLPTSVTVYYPAGNTSGWTKPTWTAPDGSEYNTAVFYPNVNPDDFTYTVNSDGETITITGFVGEQTGDLIIPSEIDGYTVTTIGDYAFYGCSGFTGTLTIPDSVTTIGDYAFVDCTNLTEIFLSENLTLINEFAFGRCTSLTEIVIPNSVSSIGKSAFFYCTSLTKISLSNNLKSIEYMTFGECENLTKIEIPDNVTSIGSHAFFNCTGLTEVLLPTNIKSIDEFTFYNCRSLKQISIPNSIISLGNSSFKNCSSLIEVCIPDNVTSIEKEIFSGCTSLKDISIPYGVTTIGENAFNSCSSLIEIVLPNSITSIEKYAFYNCTSLSEISFPNSFLTIDEYAFSHCTSLTSISLPDGISYIGKGIFESCTNLVEVSLPTYNMTMIPSLAFSNCTSLTEISISSRVFLIGEKAFYGCSKLKAAYFYGDAPSCGATVLPESVLIYYLEGASDWTSPTWEADDGTVYNTATFSLSYSVSGSIESDGSTTDAVTVKFIDSNGNTVETVETTDGTYTVSVPSGSYTVEVSAENHVTRTYTVVVENGAVSQDIKLHLIGDIDGDGVVNNYDIDLALNHYKKLSLLSGYELSCADVNEDGVVNIIDVNRMNLHFKGKSKLW